MRFVEWYPSRCTTNGVRHKLKRKYSSPSVKQRIRSKIYNLSLDISALKQQIHDLSVHRSLLAARANRQPTGKTGTFAGNSVVTDRRLTIGFLLADSNKSDSHLSTL